MCGYLVLIYALHSIESFFFDAKKYWWMKKCLNILVRYSVILIAIQILVNFFSQQEVIKNEIIKKIPMPEWFDILVLDGDLIGFFDNKSNYLIYLVYFICSIILRREIKMWHYDDERFQEKMDQFLEDQSNAPSRSRSANLTKSLSRSVEGAR